MTAVFRVLLLITLALFWGGLTCYTGFVVRIIHSVLNDPMDGGLITQRVTNVLQILGAVACVFMLQNSVAVSRHTRKHGSVLAICSILFCCSLIGLHVVHGQLDAVIDVTNHEVTDRESFVAGHRRYNQLTTVQWLSSSAYLVMTALAWRSVDSNLAGDKSSTVNRTEDTVVN